MAGTLKTNAVQLGDSVTATQNFVWQTNVDGTAKLARGNVGATTQDILTVDAAGNVNIPLISSLTGVSTLTGAAAGMAVTNVSSINGGPLAGLRNRIINGAFDVWQRGTSFTGTSPYYGPDRWQCYRQTGSAGATFSQASNNNTTGSYYIKMSRDSGNALVTALTISTSFETIENYKLYGKTVTLSFTAVKGANFSATGLTAQVVYGLGLDGNIAAGLVSQAVAFGVTVPAASISSSALGTVFQVTGTVPTSASQLGVVFIWTPTGTAGAADWVGVGQVQLEVGSVATPFEQRPYGMELALCQRYLQSFVSPDTFGSICSGYAQTATTMICTYPFVVTPRVPPSGITIGAATLYSFTSTATTVASAVAFNSASLTSGVLTVTTAGQTAGQGGRLFANAAGEKLLWTGCEL